MIIDVHGHLAKNPEDLDRIVNSGAIEQVWLLAIDFPEPIPGSSLEIAGGDEVLRVSKQYGDFFVPFGYLDFRQPPDIVDRLHEKGFVGLKAIRPGKPYDDESYFPYYRRAEELGMPILFHLGGITAHPPKVVGEGLSVGPSNMRPYMLETITAACPKLTLIGAHLGGLWSDEVLECAREFENIYFDISGGNTFLSVKWLWDNLQYAGVIDKVLMGIDSVYGSREIHEDIFEATKFWELQFKYMGSPYIWADQVDKILRLNARSIIDKAGGIHVRGRVPPMPETALGVSGAMRSDDD